MTVLLVLPTGKQHSSDFSRLIAQVRGRLDDNRQSGIKQEVTVEGEDEEKPQSTGTSAGSGIIMTTLTDVDRANDHVRLARTEKICQ